MPLIVSYGWPRDEAAVINEFSRAKIRKGGKVEKKKKYLASQGLIEVASES